MTEEQVEPETGSVPSNGKLAPPYIAFSSAMTLLDQMQEHGPPSQLERGFFRTASGGTVAAFLHALRYFQLVDENYKTRPRLAELVNPETRPAQLKQLLDEYYPEAMALSGERASLSQLDRVFASKGLAGETVRKCASFFIQMAKSADVPLSPYFTSSRAGTARSVPRARMPGSNIKKRKASQTKATGKPADPVTQPTVESPPERQGEVEGQSPKDLASQREAQRIEYVNVLLGLVKENPDASMLDRLERVLGFQEPASATPPATSGGPNNS